MDHALNAVVNVALKAHGVTPRFHGEMVTFFVVNVGKKWLRVING
jgi:hypothetical protein